MSFTSKDLIQLYQKKKELYGAEAYRHISKILRKAKFLHKSYFDTRGKTDHEQSWTAFKGNNFEKIVSYILDDEVRSLGLKMSSGISLNGLLHN